MPTVIIINILKKQLFKNVSQITLGQEFRSEEQTSLSIFSRFQSDHNVFKEFMLGFCLCFTKHWWKYFPLYKSYFMVQNPYHTPLGCNLGSDFSPLVDLHLIFEKSSWKNLIFVYRMRAIITRGLYIFYPLFEGQKRFFKGLFS